MAVLSAETMKKQKGHHPELTAEDYAKAQEAVENGEKWPQNEKNLAFILNEPEGVVVIVKAIRIGDEFMSPACGKRAAMTQSGKEPRGNCAGVKNKRAAGRGPVNGKT